MYRKFYNFSSRPFQLTPDPHFFFEGRPHKKAMAYLTYGLSQREGFVVITGEVGTGKTILIDHLLSKIERDQYIAGKVVTTLLEPGSLLRMIAFAFGLDSHHEDKAETLTALSAFLSAAHQRNVRPLLIIDEAQNLSPSALEELRMLSNFQSVGRPLLQSFLVGQPQFRLTLASRQLEQFGQRIIASHHLDPLAPEETVAYIRHRLGIAGWSGDPNINQDAFSAIYDVTEGVPRRVNILMDRLLLFSFLEQLHEVDGTVVLDVLRDVRHEGLPNFIDPAGAARETVRTGAQPRPADRSGEAPDASAEIERLNARIAELELRLRSDGSK